MNKLLELVNEDAKLTPKQLATMLGKTEQEVEEEIAKLEASGVIKGYRALIDWEKADENKAFALIELRVTPQKDRGFDEIAERIASFEEVDSVYLMSGGYDLSVVVKGKSMHEIAQFVARKLSLLSGVLSTATHFVLTKYKESGVLFNDDADKDERGIVR